MKESGDKIRSWRFEAAFRCQDCKTRFVASSVQFGDLRFAHCPSCRRMDLNQWSGKTYTPTGWTAVKVTFGAMKWRCEYCRLNFASFRKRKEIFSFRRWQRMNVGNAVREGRARVAEQEDKAELKRELAEKLARETPRDAEDEA